MFYQNLAFRRNSTVCMGFYFLWSHVPFEYISSSMSPPLHCESAHCVLQMLDVEVSSVADTTRCDLWTSRCSSVSICEELLRESGLPLGSELTLKIFTWRRDRVRDGAESWLSSQEWTALTGNPSSDPSICPGWFTTAWISNLRDSDSLFWPPQTLHSYTHVHTQTTEVTL